MRILSFVAPGTLLALASPVAAQEAGEEGVRISAAITGGTLGIGPELGVRFSDHLGVRGSATFLGVGANFDVEDIEYDGDLNLESYGAMLDVYPFGSHFRLSAGARINNNRGRVAATPQGTVELGDQEYTAAQVGTLRGRADVKNLAPALTLGWSGARRRGFMFSFDAGVLFQGSVRVRDFTASGTAAASPAFRTSLEAERRELQDDIDDYKAYPIAQVSIGWRF